VSGEAGGPASPSDAATSREASFNPVNDRLTPKVVVDSSGGAHASTPDGSTPDGSTPDGSTPDGSTPDGDGAEVSADDVDPSTTRPESPRSAGNETTAAGNATHNGIAAQTPGEADAAAVPAHAAATLERRTIPDQSTPALEELAAQPGRVGSDPLPASGGLLPAAAAPVQSPLPAPAVDRTPALPDVVVSVAAQLVATALEPLLGPGGPGSPASAALWALLAWVRREVEQSVSSLSVVSSAAAATVSMGVQSMGVQSKGVQSIGTDPLSILADPAGWVLHTLFNTSPVPPSQSSAVALAENQTSQPISLGGVDADGDALAYTVSGPGSAGGTLTISGGTATYTPPSTWKADSTYDDTFTVAVADSGSHVHGLSGLLHALSFGLLGDAGHSAAGTVTVHVTPATPGTVLTAADRAFWAPERGVGFSVGSLGALEDQARLESALRKVSDLGFTTIRTWGTDQYTGRILEAITRLNLPLQVQPGIYITRDADARGQIDSALAIIAPYQSKVVGVSLGNEQLVDWNTSATLTVPQVIDQVAYFKSKSSLPVTYDFAGETFLPGASQWNQNLAGLVSELDYVSVHSYGGFFDNRNNPAWTPARQLASVKSYEAMLSDKLASLGLGDKPIILGETGWQSTGYDAAVTNPANMQQYYELVSKYVYGAGARFDGMFYFNFTDEAWKGGDDHWGLFAEGTTTAVGAPKFAIVPVSQILSGGQTGPSLRVVEARGGVSLLVDQATGLAYIQPANLPAVAVTRSDAYWTGPVPLTRGDATMLAAERDASGLLRVLDTSSAGQFGWILDEGGHFTGEQKYDATTLPGAETLFGLDINGDGKIGSTTGAGGAPAGAPGSFPLTLVNNTGGAYRDDQIFVTIIGQATPSTWSWIDEKGVAHAIDHTAANAPGHLVKNGVNYADMSFSLADAGSLPIPPTLDAGRMYVSLGQPLYIGISPDDKGWAGPNPVNPTDPNFTTVYDWYELSYTYAKTPFGGNTTQVDQFALPMAVTLQQSGVSESRGITATRDQLFARFAQTAPPEFQALVIRDAAGNPLRIIAPRTQQPGALATWLDGAVNDFWAKYTNETFSYTGPGYTVSGRIDANSQFAYTVTAAGVAKAYKMRKPTTAEIFGCDGPFIGSAQQGAFLAALSAAFNRGVASTPTQWNNVAAYYPAGQKWNAYAKFFHEVGLEQLAYGFPYDDVNNQSSVQILGNSQPPGRLTLSIGF